MPNWYDRVKNQGGTSRYTGTMVADIVVPYQDDKEMEKEIAHHVLDRWLPEDPDASARTAIDSTINVQITGVEQHG